MMRCQAATRILLLVAVLLLRARCITGESATQRASQLKSMKLSQSTRMLSFDIDSFEKFIESAPRPYSIFVMFHADPCKPCSAMQQQLQKISIEYERLADRKKPSQPLYFAELKITSQDEDFLRKYAITSIPILYFFKGGSSRSFPKQLTKDSNDMYKLEQLGLGANALKEFINTRSGSRLTIVRGGYQIPFVQTVRALMPFIFGIVGMSGAVAVISGAYKSPMLWFALVMLVYIFSVGGGHYSWIHNTPLAVVNNEGVWEYVARGSRSQYVAEGFFVSATCVSISVLVILLQELPSVLPSKSGQTVVGTAMVVMTCVAISALLVLYHQKMPQYLQYSEM